MKKTKYLLVLITLLMGVLITPGGGPWSNADRHFAGENIRSQRCGDTPGTGHRHFVFGKDCHGSVRWHRFLPGSWLVSRRLHGERQHGGVCPFFFYGHAHAGAIQNAEYRHANRNGEAAGPGRGRSSHRRYEPGFQSNAVVLKGKDLDALSDDPDELENQLQALAGPAAGPNGGQIYIDGFTGGQIPPKSSIREIRVNQNPFSAEFDRSDMAA